MFKCNCILMNMRARVRVAVCMVRKFFQTWVNLTPGMDDQSGGEVVPELPGSYNGHNLCRN